MVDTSTFTLAGKKVWVAGYTGMVGSALVRRLTHEGCQILTVPHAELDLRRQQDVEAWLHLNKPDVVYLAAATVGGIHANATRPAEFIFNNLAIETNIIHSAYQNGVSKLIFLASSCIYPRLAEQPITEASLLTGPLEPTNEWYAVAKIAGLKMCQAYRRQYGCDYISVVPANLYGKGDNYDPLQGHVVAATLAKVHNAKLNNLPSIEIWGTGTPVREFLTVDDMADATIFLTKNYSGEDPINIGTGIGTTIQELVETVAKVVGYDGDFVNNLDKPDGMPRKTLDVSLLQRLGWLPTTDLHSGLRAAYEDYLAYLTAGGKST